MEKENSRPNARVKLQTLSKSVSKMFKQGEIVWVNLGISFSWWPGEFQEVAVEKGKKTSDLDIDINVSENPFKNITSNSGDTVLDTDGGLQTRKKPKEEVANDTNAKKDPFKVSEVEQIVQSKTIKQRQISFCTLDLLLVYMLSLELMSDESKI